MNLIEFNSMISSKYSTDKINEESNEFSEEVVVYNILNGNFDSSNIIDITIPSKSKYCIRMASEELVDIAENKLNSQYVPGSFYPFYQVTIDKKKDNLFVMKLKKE